MTKSQTEKISKAFLGHMMTDTDFRKSIQEARDARDHESIARIINRHLKPSVPVKPTDIPKIRQHLSGLLRKARGSAPKLRVDGAASMGLMYSKSNP